MSGQEVLALGPDAETAATISQAFTPQCSELLKNASDAKEAVRKALADPMVVAECQRVADRVKRFAGPMGKDAVYVALQPLLILFGPPSFGEGREALQGAWIAIYQDALHHLPREALEAAVSDWILNGKPFFPKPAELNKLARPKLEEVALIAWRCRQVADAAAMQRPKEISAEDRALVAQGLRELGDTLSATAAKAREAMVTPRQNQHAMAERLRAAAES